MPIEDEIILENLNQVLLYLIDGKIESANDLLDKLDPELTEKNLWSELTANFRKYLIQYKEGAEFLRAIANGNLSVVPPQDPNRDNIMISQYKQLQSILSHLIWQTQQIANGDLNQKITFLGDLSISYNRLIASLREMRQLEERLRLASNSGKIGIWDWDIVNDTLIWDDSMYYLYCIRKEDFGGAYDAWIKTLHPEDKEYIEGEIQAAIRGVHEYSPEFRIITADGSVKVIKAESKTIRDQSGKALRMTGTNIDITHTKQAEIALKENELKFRTLFETAGDAILLFTEGRWVDCNARALRIFGCTRNQIIGANPGRFSPPRQPDGQSSEELTIERINLAYSGKPQFFEWEHCRADATPFTTEVNLNRLDVGGKQYIQAIVRDVSGRKLAEAKVSEQLNELRRWYDAIADREDRIIEMKMEVNKLLTEAGKPPRYESVI